MARKALKIILGTLLAVVLVAVFYVAVVLGHPQENPEKVVVSQDQPVLTASPAQSLTTAAGLEAMLQVFPVPALYAVEGSELTLTAGMSYDAAYEDGFARIMLLNYSTQLNGQTVQLSVQSIYPARALEFVPKGDYHIAGVAGQPLAGMQSVRMEDGTGIRLHAQAAEGIYVLTVPVLTADELAAVTRSLQLYAPREEN
ncbi:MAG: hypothetical protein E7316_05090 [Clostridiales bacterium]|nr:hypothetical protein [Clostridiales bacterium]